MNTPENPKKNTKKATEYGYEGRTCARRIRSGTSVIRTFCIITRLNRSGMTNEGSDESGPWIVCP